MTLLLFPLSFVIVSQIFNRTFGLWFADAIRPLPRSQAGLISIGKWFAMLAASLLEHGGVLTADSTIKYNPDKAVLKLPIGAPIRLTAAGFTALAEAYFADLTAKFGQAG